MYILWSGSDHFGTLWWTRGLNKVSNVYQGCYCNHSQNICRHFLVLAQLSFTTSKLDLDYYHLKVNEHVASRIAEQLKNLRKLGNFKKIPENLSIDGKSSAGH